MSAMTDEQYVASNGFRCPGCMRSTPRRIGDVEFDDSGLQSVALQEATCDACGARWTDVYHLRGYQNFEEESE